MKTTQRKSFATLALLVAFLLPAASQAEVFRAYLASDGSDANPCTLAQPCRLLPAALSAVMSDGEIWMLDSANYNSSMVTVAKSVTILAVPGAVGSVVAAGGHAINITAGGLKVVLRNLVVVPLPGGGGINGLNLTGASQVFIEHSNFSNLPSAAIYVNGIGSVRVSNTTLRLNGFGMFVEGGGAASVFNSEFHQNQVAGLHVKSGQMGADSRVSVTGSLFAGHAKSIWSRGETPGSYASAYVTDCTLDAGGIALQVESIDIAQTRITVNRTMVSNMQTAWHVQGAGAGIYTLGNNVFIQYANSTGVLTPMAAQ